MSAIPRFSLFGMIGAIIRSSFFHNLHEQPGEILVDPGVNNAQGKLLVNLLAEDHSRANESGKHRIILEGYGCRWYRVGGLDYLLRRTDIDQRDTDEG